MTISTLLAMRLCRNASYYHKITFSQACTLARKAELLLPNGSKLLFNGKSYVQINYSSRRLN